MRQMERLANICNANLKNCRGCIGHLKERGITGNYAKKYKIGFFPQNISKLKKHVSEEFLVKSSILKYDRTSDFKDYHYLIFPIYSEHGCPVAISGRSLLTSSQREALGIPKYKNSKYKKSYHLYGLNLARWDILGKQNVYIVEGQIDKIKLDMAGVTNSVAVCGTAFSKQHFAILARYTDKMTFIMDNDDAGRVTAEKLHAKFVNNGIKLRVWSVPSSSKDIDEYLGLSTKTWSTFLAEKTDLTTEFLA